MSKVFFMFFISWVSFFSSLALAINNPAGPGGEPHPISDSSVAPVAPVASAAKPTGEVVKVNPKAFAEFGNFITKCKTSWMGTHLPAMVNAFSKENGFVVEDLMSLRAEFSSGLYNCKNAAAGPAYFVCKDPPKAVYYDLNFKKITSPLSTVGAENPVSIPELKSKLAVLAQECNTFGRNGDFYLCQIGSQAKYFDRKLQRLQARLCDQVLLLGSHIACLKKKTDANLKTILEAQTSSQSDPAGVRNVCPETADMPAPAAGAPGSPPYGKPSPQSTPALPPVAAPAPSSR